MMRHFSITITSKMIMLLGFVLALLGCGSAGAQERLQQQQPAELYFTVSPEDHQVVEGLPVKLRCRAEPHGTVEYAWKIDGQPLAPSPRRHVKDGGGDLHITRVSRILDSGNFVCAATHKRTGTSIESSPAKIEVQWISEASVQLQLPKLAPLIRAGGKVELRCHVDGSGELKYEWFRNTHTVASSDRVEMRRNLLVVEEAAPEDNGIYRCLARNNAGASPIARSLPLIVPSNLTSTIRVVPEKAIVRRGESASFNCVFDNADRVHWYYEQKGPLDSDDEYTILDNGTILVHKATERTKGFYSCHGLRDDTHQIYSVELEIAYLKNLSVASFEPPMEEAGDARVAAAVVGENQELQISCLAPGGLPSPKLFWRDPQGRIVSDSGPVRVQDDTLIVAKARREADPGNYTCVAENMVGSTEMSVQVIVSWPAEMRDSPQSVTVLEDEPATLSCSYRAMAPPVTETRWLKDGEPLKEDGRTGGPPRLRLLEQPGSNSTLQLRNVQLGDKGSYACEVTTKGFPPLISSPAVLSIKEKLKFSPPPVNRRLELNSTAKVSCKAQGSTPPTFKWYKNGAKQFPKHVQEMNGTLHFSGVLEEDKGNYTCVAVNGQGQINHTIKIDVVIAPKFTVKPENVSAIEGLSVLLHCAAEGDPKPAIKWDKDSQMNNLNGDRFLVMANGSLYIKEVYLSDEGKYGCTAGNSGGLKREEVHLTVKAGDGYRSDLDLDAADDGSMMTKTVVITLGAAAAYMVLVVGLMLYCRYRRRRRKQRYLQEQTEGQEKGENAEVQEEQCELRETSAKVPNNTTKKRRDHHRDHHHQSHRSDGNDTAHSLNSNLSRKSKSSYDKLAVSRSHLHDMKPLGRGEFGEIFSCKFRPGSSSGGSGGGEEVKESVVMVKTLNNTKDENVLQDIKRHLDLLNKLNHENIAKLIGLCREEDPDYMIIEYTDWGDLKQFLLASRGTKENPETGKQPRAPQLAVSQILSIANQAAQGLKFISDNRLVHKDVAARNCLISSNLTVKISLACMTKEPHQQEYTKYRNQIIPLRWMPKEAVFEDEYSTKSDVYSYSCLVWEIFHQGDLPFKKLNDDSIIQQLKSQTLIWMSHKAAPPALQELQTQCWSYDPRERPTFNQIVVKLQEIAQECSQV